MLQLAETATPGPWWTPLIKTESGEIVYESVRTSWKYDLNKRIRDKNGERILKEQGIYRKNCAFKNGANGHIYLCESEESQHIANARYIANFHPGVAISLIEKIIDYRELISKLYGLLRHTQVANLDKDLVDKIHDAIEMGRK